MAALKADIIAQLKKEMLQLQGFKNTGGSSMLDSSLGAIKNVFPQQTFPTSAIHEFISTGAEDAAATSGFIACLVASLMCRKGASLWISQAQTVFPPALKSFNISPERIIFIELKKEKELLWVIEEALKCEGVAAVVGELKALSFTASRRLQLAVEQSKVTGFIIRNNEAPPLNTTACIARWRITSLPSDPTADLPGIGFPRWNVELLKVRNGYTGNWQIEYRAGRFRHLYKLAAIAQPQRKTG